VRRKLGHLWRKDLLTVYRDRIMILLALTPLQQAGVVRWLLVLADRHLPNVPGDLPVLFGPMMVLLPALLLGSVAGLGLVAEREMRTVVSLRVTPLPYPWFVAYVVGWPAAGAIVLSVPSLALYGLAPADVPLLAAATAVTALTSGAVALFLGGLASNRIEALAASKSLSLLLLTAMSVFVVAPAGQLLLAGWSPWYWAYLALIGGLAGGNAAHIPYLNWPGYPPGVILVACLVTAAGWTWLLSRWYLRRAG